MPNAIPENQLNLQKRKTSKIFGITKMGANQTDQNVIKRMQLQGYNEFEIQSEAGVHFSVVRSFMAHFAKQPGYTGPDYVETNAPITPETQHLHDKIAELEAKLGGSETSPGDTEEDEEEDEDL